VSIQVLLSFLFTSDASRRFVAIFSDSSGKFRFWFRHEVAENFLPAFPALYHFPHAALLNNSFEPFAFVFHSSIPSLFYYFKPFVFLFSKEGESFHSPRLCYRISIKASLAVSRSSIAATSCSLAA
jgi:hypothetical protein